MRRLYAFLVVLACSNTIFAQHKKEITLEDIWRDGTFRLKSIPGFNATKDGFHYTTNEAKEKGKVIRQYDLATGEGKQVFFDGEKITFNGKSLGVTHYEFSQDEQKIILFTEGEQIYRHSAAYNTYLYDRKTQQLKPISTEKVLHATFSPSGNHIAYVLHNDLYLYDLVQHSSKRITTDGKRNAIINGNCDWVYEEEFGFTQAYQWSPDGNFLAYYKFDEQRVPMYTMTVYDSLYPRPYTFKYPKAGDANSLVSIYAYQVKDGQSHLLHQTKADTEEYVPRIKWAAQGNKLCVYVLNRHQNHLQLRLHNVEAKFRGMYASKLVQTIYEEKNPYYLDINDNLTFLKDGESILFDSEREGYNQLYHYNFSTKKLKKLTQGKYDVDQIIGVDEELNLLYFTAALPTPMDRKLYSVNWHNKKILLLTPERGTHRITAIKGNKYFLDAWSNLDTVPQYFLRNQKGQIVRVLEDNAKAAATLSQYNLGHTRLLQVKGKEEWLNAWMITPPNFDSTKKYPLLLFQYSGPKSQQVADKFPIADFFWHQMLAQKGYVILCADGTGTGFRGQEFAKKTYLQLGNLESDDQIAVAKYMGNKSWIDASRIGIWGWSYGGFMSSICILKGSDVFKTAIAVAPVTNWRYYDNIYTERYMRTPAENAKGYDENAPAMMADKLKGNYLLIHGTGDDNVHFQNAAIMVKNLVNANKQFNSEFYTDKAHGISGGRTRLQLYTRMTNFVLDNL